MTAPPVISVVVPVRNDPDQLRACLTSLAGSTLREHEVIVVDDASTDQTPETAASLGVRVVRQDQRTGPAAARNRGVAEARGGYVMFVDADVCVHPDTLARVVAAFEEDPRTDALFGSYDLVPRAPNFLSQYKNLFHHFVHQRAADVASTFWTGCGAIRRAVFLEAGGFDTRYRRPAIEDIELGVRLVRSGRRIVVRKDVQATHLKRWTLIGLMKSDVWDRAVPWTELILRDGRLPNDLNLETAERVSALLAWGIAGLALGALVGDPVGRVSCLGALPAALIAFVAWNRELYRFFLRERGWRFAARVVPFHLLYYLYGVAAFAVGVARHWWRGGSPEPVPDRSRGGMKQGTVSMFKAEEAAGYDRVADQFAVLSERYAGDLASRVADLACITPGDRVLDVGTGAGIVAAAAAERVGASGRVLGIDISAGLLSRARDESAARGLGERLEYRLMDAEALELGDGSFDVVVSLFALLHLPDPLRALREMRRVLRPAGRLVVGVGSGAPVSLGGFVHRLRRLGTLWSERRGRRLSAPGSLESLLTLRMGPEEGASVRWREHARGHRPGPLGDLLREAGFARVQAFWQGRDLEVPTAEGFWDLQRTLSSSARRRLAAASPSVVNGLRREMVARSEAVLAGGGRLVYPQGVLFLCALRDTP